MEFVIKTFRAFGPVVVEAVKQAISVVSVSGKSAEKVRFEVKSPTKEVDRLTIFGPGYIETGRGPRKSSEESGFEDNLYEWIQAKFPGISPVQQKKLSKFLRWKINKEGDKTYKEGGRQVYSQVLTKATDDIKRAVVKEYRINFSKFVKNAFHGSNDS